MNVRIREISKKPSFQRQKLGFAARAILYQETYFHLVSLSIHSTQFSWVYNGLIVVFANDIIYKEDFIPIGKHPKYFRFRLSVAQYLLVPSAPSIAPNRISSRIASIETILSSKKGFEQVFINLSISDVLRKI